MDGAVVVALFRHGITEANKRRAFIGWTDVPLCNEAVPMLEKQKTKLTPYQWLISSDLKRCVQTAELLFPGQAIERRPEFREMHFGHWEGKVHEELAGHLPYEQWLQDWLETVIPGGESAKLFYARVEPGWKTVCRSMAEKKVSSAAIVTHAGVMRYLLTAYGNEERSFWEWKIPNGSGYEFIWQDWEAFRRGERCTLLREVPLTENPHG